MISLSLDLTKIKILIICLVIAVIFPNITPVYGDTSESIIVPSFSVNQKIPLTREIGEPITLAELGLESWRNLPEDIPTENDLIKASIYFRDIARYLGADLPITLSITDPQTEEVKYRITDFREVNGNWITISTGYALKIVTQEMQILKESRKQPLIDLLIRDELTQNYRPILQISLIRYCYELLNYVKDSYR